MPLSIHLKQASEPLSKLSAAITRRIQLLETRIKLLKCDFGYYLLIMDNDNDPPAALHFA